MVYSTKRITNDDGTTRIIRGERKVKKNKNKKREEGPPSGILTSTGQLKKQKVIQSFSPSSSLWWEPIQVGTPHPLFLPEH